VGFFGLVGYLTLKFTRFGLEPFRSEDGFTDAKNVSHKHGIRRQLVELRPRRPRSGRACPWEFEPTARTVDQHWVAQATGRGPAGREGQRALCGWGGIGPVRRGTRSCGGSATCLLSGRLIRQRETARSRPGSYHERAPGPILRWPRGARVGVSAYRISCVAVVARRLRHAIADTGFVTADRHRPRELTRTYGCAAGCRPAQAGERRGRSASPE